ncbi:MAG: ferrochelatase [Nitrospirota bacterium]|nr:ferrochelatase [Nitrospirota bacterium]
MQMTRGNRGVLLVNLGTPEAPTQEALRTYLAEFLWDRRVVDVFRPLWWLILHLRILRTRPARSAALYQKIWTAEGSPLLVMARSQAAALAQALSHGRDQPVPVVVGMRYGTPSIASGLRELVAQGCGNVVALPLFPQYSQATTLSAQDAILAAVKGWTEAPIVKLVHDYHDHPAYIEALAASVREAWQESPPGNLLLMSFHGTPARFRERGDPYAGQCEVTAHLLAQALGLPLEKWRQTYQSRFGREEWLQPYTDEILDGLARAGTSAVDILCPGFPADCLETLEEIAATAAEHFQRAGGGQLRYIPALGDRPDHIEALAQIIRSHF